MQGAGLRGRVRQALASQPQRTVTVLSSLLAVQDALGYIPPETVEEVASFRGATVNEVWDVASFYTNFRFTPPGRNTVEVCWGPPCHLRGAPEVLARLQEALGLSSEGDTPDGRVTLKYTTCLGACSQAPVLMLNHRIIGGATPQLVASLLSRLTNGHGSEGNR